MRDLDKTDKSPSVVFDLYAGNEVDFMRPTTGASK